ncbi:hypothetical protein GEV33_008942 [Tenebrio molitor]|uniref:THAP-type domain-containing protein n=1 Tax=Tenebrio molitor TaxID=7067 RepID=A0A8J6L9M7_TENMO|nr:hypothetical protein GEV33_008942 [Tenebrio molitor]
MPRRCVVPGCKSNYDSTLKQNNSVTTFAFPKDEKKKQAWMRAIPRADWSPTAHSAVCIKHFHESHIIKHQPYKNPTSGEIQKLLLQHPKLTEDAIPKVFDNLPAYLSKKEPPARTSPDCRREQVLKRNAVKIEEFLKEDIIIIDKWHHNISDRCVWFYSLNVDSVQNNDVKEDQLKVVCSISVSNEMVVKCDQPKYFEIGDGGRRLLLSGANDNSACVGRVSRQKRAAKRARDKRARAKTILLLRSESAQGDIHPDIGIALPQKLPRRTSWTDDHSWLHIDSALGTSNRTLSSSAPETLPRWTSRAKVLPTTHPCCLFTFFLLNKVCVFSTVLHRNRTLPKHPKRIITKYHPTWAGDPKKYYTRRSNVGPTGQRLLQVTPT